MASQLRASHILVDTEQKANDLKKRIEGGEGFADIAKQNSSCPSGRDGGDLGWFSKGQMVKPFEDVAFGAEENAVAGPVKTQFGYHLILVTGKQG
jgi:peptidyl-prolyl cis-trans isomerase C